MNYIGTKCPVCGRPFLEGDDIVVCPQCGAPYHRHCYHEAGKCIFSDKHGTGESWQPPKVEAPRPKEGERIKKCPRCEKMNDVHALFCDQCGFPLAGVPDGPVHGAPETFQDQPQNPYENGPYQNPTQGGFPGGGSFYGPPGQNPQGPGGPVPIMFDPMGGVNPSESIGGVPAGDIAKVVQNNTPYYLPAFINLERFRRNRFNFCAFLFSGGWLLYRKQYALGAVISSIMAALYFAYIFFTFNYTAPILYDLYEKVGISADTIYPPYEQMLELTDLLYAMEPMKVFLFFLPVLIMAVQFIAMLVIGFKGNRLYYKHCVQKAKTIREQNPDDAQYQNQLRAQGGVNTSLAVCLLICYMLIMYLPNFLMI